MTDQTMADLNNSKIQRNIPGIRYQEFYESFENYQNVDDCNSPFPYQDYLQQIIRQDRTALDKIVQLPENGNSLVWQYEHLRQVCLELNGLLVALDDECTLITCQDMKANDWQYLCAAHPQPKTCCAYDYMVHTIDGACMLLNNTKFFPTRISMPTNASQQFANIARRLYRIFAHSYYSHRQIFNMFESETNLYARFVKFVATFELMSTDSISF